MAVDTTIALITLADAKSYLKVATGTTSEDAIISDLINEVSVWINSYCGRQFIQTTYTEYYEGTGDSSLVLKQFPVQSVTSLYRDVTRQWTVDTAIDLVHDVQLDADTGLLVLWNHENSFGTGPGIVKVVYSAGYPIGAVPYDLQLACRKMVAWKYFQDYSQRRFGVKSEAMQDRTVTYTEEALLADVEQILNLYKRVRCE